jgi:peroxiredoxin Q/BCP
MKILDVGDKVPDFSLNDQHDHVFRLSEVTGTKNLVIYFYPKDDTPGCTAEACHFRDEHQAFVDNDAVVIGISADSTESHRNFARKNNLNYTLLSDPDQEVRKLFGIRNDFFGLIPGRVTFVVDKAGVIRHRFHSQWSMSKHMTTALEILRNLS